MAPLPTVYTVNACNMLWNFSHTFFDFSHASFMHFCASKKHVKTPNTAAAGGPIQNGGGAS
jgi:hypothetical protein